MAGDAKRVLVSGMGGELGTRVASLLEERDWVGDLLGIDIDPPRGRLRRARFRRSDPRDRARTAAIVADFDPHVLLHLGVYEPNARASPAGAWSRTIAAATAVLGAAGEGRSLETIVVRSGIEVYGRRRGAPLRPDESTPPDPTSRFGEMLLRVEQTADEAGRLAGDVPVTQLRLAPVLGPHVSSPLGRYLRMPVVPVELLADPPFTVLHVHDAAEAVVAAARAGHHGAVNVVAPGAVTPFQAVRLGGRVPLPLGGPPWWVARPLVAAAGAPVPDHLLELLRRGRVADGTMVEHLLGMAPEWTAEEVVRQLYAWASITHLRPLEAVA